MVPNLLENLSFEYSMHQHVICILEKKIEYRNSLLIQRRIPAFRDAKREERRCAMKKESGKKKRKRDGVVEFRK